MSTSCHEEGRVDKILSGNRALIVVERGEACGACAAKGACQSLGGPRQDLSLVVDNPINAMAGDTVQISMDETAVVKASTILYLVPALCLIGGAVLGHSIANMRGWETDPLAIVGSLLGVGTGLFLAWLLGKWMAKRKSIVPRLTAITARPVQ